MRQYKRKNDNWGEPVYTHLKLDNEGNVLSKEKLSAMIGMYRNGATDTELSLQLNMNIIKIQKHINLYLKTI